MLAVEIIVITAGFILLIGSFVMAGGRSVEGMQQQAELSSEEIKRLVEREMETISERLKDVSEESVEHGTEAAERSLEKVSNEKIMAINEFSSSVLESINKNHDEAVFLYSMLKQKEEECKKALEDADQAKSAIAKENAEARRIREEIRTLLDENDSMGGNELLQEIERIEKKRTTDGRDKKHRKEMIEENRHQGPKMLPETQMKIQKVDHSPAEETGMQSVQKKEEEKKRDRIFALHQEGRDSVSIAKELGIGVGETELILKLLKKAAR